MTETSLFKDYHTLFSKFFIENCQLDQEDITEEESKALNELDANEVFENFSDLVSQLLKFKKQCISTDQAELIKKCNSFEALIQKLENEVRTHIGVQHQLKIILESFQTKIQTLEKTNQELLQKVSDSENLLKKYKRSKSIELEEEEPEKKPKVKVLHKRNKSDLDELKKFAKTGKLESALKVKTKKNRVSLIEKIKPKTVRGKHLRSSSDLVLKAKLS
jgi:TolA-binding protein